MDESKYNVSDEEMASLVEALDNMLDEEEPDFDAELIEAGWNIVRENPGIECQEWINELIRQYPNEVTDALGNNPPEVFHTLADWWEYKEYTDPTTGEWNTLQGWSEFYATDVECLQERLETANKRIKELEIELSEAKAEIKRLEALKSNRQ